MMCAATTTAKAANKFVTADYIWYGLSPTDSAKTNGGVYGAGNTDIWFGMTVYTNWTSKDGRLTITAEGPYAGVAFYDGSTDIYLLPGKYTFTACDGYYVDQIGLSPYLFTQNSYFYRVDDATDSVAFNDGWLGQTDTLNLPAAKSHTIMVSAVEKTMTNLASNVGVFDVVTVHAPLETGNEKTWVRLQRDPSTPVPDPEPEPEVEIADTTCYDLAWMDTYDDFHRGEYSDPDNTTLGSANYYKTYTSTDKQLTITGDGHYGEFYATQGSYGLYIYPGTYTLTCKDGYLIDQIGAYVDVYGPGTADDALYFSIDGADSVKVTGYGNYLKKDLTPAQTHTIKMSCTPDFDAAAGWPYGYITCYYEPDYYWTWVRVVKATSDGITAPRSSRPATDKIYDLQGRQVKKPAKGIYIVNGKKRIFK